jgi:hypothetical protein
VLVRTVLAITNIPIQPYHDICFSGFVHPCGITVKFDLSINLSGRRNLRALWLDMRLSTIKNIQLAVYKILFML